MEQVYELSMLFDFYSGMLTERQRDFFDLYHNDDLSLSEIAESAGVSRQAVHDTLTRAEATLYEIEKKTGLLARFLSSQRQLDDIILAAEELGKLCASNENSSEIVRLVGQITETAGKLKA